MFRGEYLRLTSTDHVFAGLFPMLNQRFWMVWGNIIDTSCWLAIIPFWLLHVVTPFCRLVFGWFCYELYMQLCISIWLCNYVYMYIYIYIYTRQVELLEPIAAILSPYVLVYVHLKPRSFRCKPRTWAFWAVGIQPRHLPSHPTRGTSCLGADVCDKIRWLNQKKTWCFDHPLEILMKRSHPNFWPHQRLQSIYILEAGGGWRKLAG